MKVRLLLALLSLLPGLMSVDAPQKQIILGVLEDLPGGYADQPDYRAVRVVFHKDGAEWKPFPSDCPDQACLATLPSEYPHEVTWTIAFDGRNLGQVTGRTQEHFESYADVGLQEIAAGSPVPTIGKRSADYGGFTGASMYRPLVAVSQPNFEDPEVWKPTHLQPEVVAALRKEFRRKFPTVTNCRNPYENVARPWRYRDERIEITKAYSSKNNWSVAQIALSGYRCDGPPENGDPFGDQWYVIEPGAGIRFLDTGMWLVDAGDYDGDGQSEVLFSIDRYNRGGYKLFYDDFKKSVEFIFSYH